MARSRTSRPLAQSGVLQASRVQLIRGLVRTMTKPTSPPTDLASLPQVSFPVGRADPVGNSYQRPRIVTGRAFPLSALPSSTRATGGAASGPKRTGQRPRPLVLTHPDAPSARIRTPVA